MHDPDLLVAGGRLAGIQRGQQHAQQGEIGLRLHDTNGLADIADAGGDGRRGVPRSCR